MQLLGGILVALVSVRLLQSILAALVTQSVSSQRADLSSNLLNEQIAAAKALRLQRESQQMHWNGYRKFRIREKVIEANNICSFYLVPHDGKRLPGYRPGQFVTFRFQLPDAKTGKLKPVVRCYSLSEAPREDYFRITVKRVPAPPESPYPPGVISNHLHDHIEVGDILDLQAPRGDFSIDPEESRPVVLIGGGVGITPVLSMANSILETGSQADVWLFYGVRCGADHVMREHLAQLNAAYENFHLCLCYSCPQKQDRLGEDYDVAGHVDLDLIQKTVKITNLDFYVCGPPPMMDSLVTGLREWGVPEEQVHLEAFGPATIRKAAKPSPESGETQTSHVTKKFVVEFSKSGKQLTWDGSHECLLDLAIENGIDIDSGCRAGSCGSCEIAVKQGKVNCRVEPSVEIDEGSCLACISYPESELVLDA